MFQDCALSSYALACALLTVASEEDLLITAETCSGHLYIVNEILLL